MKTIFTLITLISMNASAQFGIVAGPSISYNSGPGTQDYTGFKYRNTTITAGLYKRMKHVQVAVLYASAGSKKTETAFKSHYIQLPVTYVIGSGRLTLGLGGYVSKLVYAENYNYFSKERSFGWKVLDGRWKYYQSWDWGTVGSLDYDLGGLSLSLTYKQGFNALSRDKIDKSLNHNWNSVWCVGLEIPLKTISQ